MFLIKNYANYNVHTLVGIPNKPIFHKNLTNFFIKYLGTHLGKILLIDDLHLTT